MPGNDIDAMVDSSASRVAHDKNLLDFHELKEGYLTPPSCDFMMPSRKVVAVSPEYSVLIMLPCGSGQGMDLPDCSREPPAQPHNGNGG
jgi:hypothetical protein